MNWKLFWPFSGSRSLGTVTPTAVQKTLFGTGPMSGLSTLPTSAPLSSPSTSTSSSVRPRPSRAQPRSWLGIFLGQNRRRDTAPRLVQGEFRLRDVKPIRNELSDDDVRLIERRPARVIWETPVADRPRDDQDLAWNRLRARRREHLVVANDADS